MMRRRLTAAAMWSLWSLGVAAAQAPRMDSKACLQLPLSSPDPDTRDRAARDLYLRCDRSVVTSSRELAEALTTIVRSGTSSAMPMMLLGHVQAGRAELSTLLKAKPGPMVKLESWNKPVPAALAAAVALSRLGDPEGNRQLQHYAAQKDLPIREFLLDVAAELPDEKLPLLRPYLDDKREITSGVPSGATPRRRLCDAAAVSFAKRLPLKLEFPITESRQFTATELSTIRTAADTALKPPAR
jgi:hypothetical protein